MGKEIFQEGDSRGALTFCPSDTTWCIKITAEGQIIFNREGFPNSTPDEFAKAFIDILERSPDFKAMLDAAYEEGFEDGQESQQ